MNPFYIFIGTFVIAKKLVDFVFGGLGAAASGGAKPAQKKLSDNEIEIYEPKKDGKNAD